MTQYLVRALRKGDTRGPRVLTRWMADRSDAEEFARNLSSDWTERQIVIGRGGMITKIEDFKGNG